MKIQSCLVCAVLLVAPFSALAAAESSDVDVVVAAVKAAHPDLRSLCQSGPDGIRKAVTEVIMPLVGDGKIKGNPQAIGGEAGQKIGRECRGA